MRTNLLWVTALVVVAVGSVVGTAFYIKALSRERLMISTTTSLYDTGLLDAIEDQFEAKYPFDLCFISVGTGLAIEHAKRGDADLILVHAPSKEQLFLENGYGLCRKIIAYNFFAIIGPQDDPAQINGLTNITQALTRIINAGRNHQATWVSRGDDSGTHTKEKTLWTNAGFDWTNLRNEDWYKEASAGMGGTLKYANQISAYTLTDMGTYLSYVKARIIVLKVQVSRGAELLNVYSAVVTNKIRHPNVNFEGAITFIKFLTSDEGQKIIDQYGKDVYAQSLFHAAVQLLKENTDTLMVEWVRNYAFLNGYECPPTCWDDHPELYE